MIDKRKTWDLNAITGLDSETCLIRPGLPAPPVVCTAIFRGAGSREIHASSDRGHWPEVLRLFEDPSRVIVGHNMAYDVGCYLEWCPTPLAKRLREAIFAAYDADRVVDTGVAQRIIQIEKGQDGFLSLSAVAKEHGMHVEKEVPGPDGEDVRTGYGQLLGLPIARYPEQYVTYSLNDPKVTAEVLVAQISTGLIAREDVAMLTRDALALHLTACQGLLPNEEGIRSLESAAKARLSELQESMLKSGFVRWQRGKPSPVKNTKVISAAVAKDLKIRTDKDGKVLAEGRALDSLKAMKLATDGGKVGYGAKALRMCSSVELQNMADYGEWSTIWNGDLKTFRYCLENDLPVSTRFGFTATTRTKSSGSKKGSPPTHTNVQNFKANRTEDDPMKVRECAKARLGALVFSDYSGLEMGTLAQVIYDVLGRRDMANKISAGWDYHCDMGGQILGGVSHDGLKSRIAEGDKAAKRARTTAKPFNFGLPGYMKKPETVMGYCRGYGVNLTVEECQKIIDLWWATQTEQVAYLETYIESLAQGRGYGSKYSVPLPRTGITRRGATRTEAANAPFQSLGARTSLRALWYVVREQMLGRAPGRACAFIHDEIGSDCKVEDIAAVERLHVWAMLEAAKEYLPDVKMAVESAAGPVWSKSTKTVRDSDGGLALDRSGLVL